MYDICITFDDLFWRYCILWGPERNDNLHMKYLYTEKTIMPCIICHLTNIDEMCRDPFVKKKIHFLSSSHQVFVTRLHILFVCKGLERLSINKCSTKTELNLRFRCTYIVLLPRLCKSCSSQNTYCFKNNSLLLHLGLLISWFQFSWNVKDEKRQIKSYSSI